MVPSDCYLAPATLFGKTVLLVCSRVSENIKAAIIVRMATSVDTDVEHHVTLVLTEDDIPGASLREPFESHTVAELCWWLLCRGITVPTKWNKAQVVK